MRCERSATARAAPRRGIDRRARRTQGQGGGIAARIGPVAFALDCPSARAPLPASRPSVYECGTRNRPAEPMPDWRFSGYANRLAPSAIRALADMPRAADTIAFGP